MRLPRLSVSPSLTAVISRSSGKSSFRVFAPTAEANTFFGVHRRDHLRKGPGVVHLRVVGDDVIDLPRIDDGGDAGHHLLPEGGLHRIDQRDLVREDQIGVVGAPAPRLITMKIPDIPVDRADPPDILRHRNGL